MKHAMPRTPKTPVFGVQTTLDLFAAPTKPCAPAHKKSDNRPPVVTPRVIADDTAAAIDLTPEPPFAIAADHYAALSQKV